MDGTRKAYPGRPRTVKIAAIAVVVMLGMVGALVFLMTRPEVEVVDDYSPTQELPSDYIIITDYPQNEEDLMAIVTLSPLVQKGKDAPYHLLIVMDPEGGLSSQELYTLSHLRTDREKILFTNGESSMDTINSQLSDAALTPIAEENTFPLTPEICSIFEGFDGVMTVASYEEALWATTAACSQNLAMVKGKASFLSQMRHGRPIKPWGSPRTTSLRPIHMTIPWRPSRPGPQITTSTTTPGSARTYPS